MNKVCHRELFQLSVCACVHVCIHLYYSVSECRSLNLSSKTNIWKQKKFQKCNLSAFLAEFKGICRFSMSLKIKIFMFKCLNMHLEI